MKKTILAVLCLMQALASYAWREMDCCKWTDPKTGIEWEYFVGEDGGLIVGLREPTGYQAVEGELVIPAVIEERQVTHIGSSAFARCKTLTSVVIPSSVKVIGTRAFQGCLSLTSVVIPSSVTNIEGGAFSHCSSLVFLTIPDGVTSIGSEAFVSCSKLKEISLPSTVNSVGKSCFSECYELESLAFYGDAPENGGSLFEEAAYDLIVYVKRGTNGWTDDNGNLMKRWPHNTSGGRPLAYIGEVPSSGNVNLTVTNVVIHYVLNSIQPNIAVPVRPDTGFVTVITEVKSSGAVSVPSEWLSNYPSFTTKYGSDFGKALMKKSGKKDGAGNDMFVWQDYVAGTDPTNPDDKFTASITLVDGVPVVSYTPELSAEQKAKRTYKTLGKKQLQDKDWEDLTNVDGEGKKLYNFFKVTVEMR